MASKNSTSLIDRISPRSDDPWPHDRQAAEVTFQPRPRKSNKRPVEPESDDNHLYTPWIDLIRVQGDETKEQRLHDEIAAYVAYIQPTQQERDTRKQVYEFVESTIKKRFSHSEVSLFGSVAFDLCLPDGDLDVVVRLADVGHQNDRKRALFQLSAALEASGVTRYAHVNHYARVPVVSFQTEPDFGSLNFDLGINNTDGFAAVEIIKTYLTTMPILRPLVLVMKCFLKQRKLHSAASAGLSSYALICMVISFLQLNPAQRFPESIDDPMKTRSLGTTLMDFLLYYGTNFPYEDSYISVTQGKLLPKESADWINHNAKRHKLVIQCLVNHENDIAKAAEKIQQVKAAFRGAHDALLKYTFTTPHTNILGSLNMVRLTRETIDNRAQVTDLVNSGKLLMATSASRFEGSSQQRSYKKTGYYYSQRSYQRQPRQYDAHFSGDGSSYYGSSGSGSGYGHSSNKRRRY